VNFAVTFEKQGSSHAGLGNTRMGLSATSSKRPAVRRRRQFARGLRRLLLDVSRPAGRDDREKQPFPVRRSLALDQSFRDGCARQDGEVASAAFGGHA